MATQAAYIADTVAGLKSALRRKDYGSDADTEIHHLTNRGWKDQKRARVTRLGRLAPPSGLDTEVVEYGGHMREIISRKPPLVDEDGYDVESDDDDDRIREATAAAAEFDPYANVRIDQILAPLSAITDIPTHATLSRPFTSPVLSQLADQSSAIMRKENQSLWRTKHLLTKLCGDFDWVPCELTMGATDVNPYADEIPPRRKAPDGGSSASASSNEMMAVGGAPSPAPPALVGGADEVSRMMMMSVAAAATNGHARDAQNGVAVDEDGEVNMVDADAAPPEATAHATKNKPDEGGKPTAPAAAENGAPPLLLPTSPRLPSNGARQSPAPPSQPVIHPLFYTPPNARANRDIGLPDHEAEELRRLLTMWVQKQEEVCRGVHMINEGVLQADRLRRDVLHWAKAEAHCGSSRDISDGEDWYDKEEWGLADDLKKGHDEGEEEEAAAAGTSSKKTRARR